MEQSKNEKKLFNVFLLGDIKSEKNKLIHQYILNNQQSKPSNSENISELTQTFEIHGETITMKISEDLQTDQIFSSEKGNTNGIILFYNVMDRESFDKLKQIILKIFNTNKYETPIVLVGTTSDNSERKITYEEAKNFSDNYGIKYHEISIENNCLNMKNVFNDLGEQVLYQDILDKEKSKKNEKEQNNENIKEMKNKTKTDIKGKKTLLQKKREDEVRERRLKREKEMQLWYKKRERESIELKKKKAIEDKQKLIEKIKEDKIIQKQREKEVKEEFLNQNKEKYEKSKKEKEEGEKKNTLEKEKSKLLLEKKRKSEKENLKKQLLENEQNDKEYIKQKRSKIHSPQSGKTFQRRNYDPGNNQNSSIFKTISEFNNEEKSNLNEMKKNQTLTNFFSPKKIDNSKKEKSNNNIMKSKSFRNTKKAKNKEMEKTEQKLKQQKEKEQKEKEEKEKEEKEKLIKEEQVKMKNELKEKYLNNNCNIYRCLYCHEIPIININEFDHQIEIYCKCKTHNIDNSFSYKYFEEKSLNHPLNNNISCIYCKKNFEELDNENIDLNFCDICEEIICSKDELVHKNENHPINKELKEKYKSLSININKKNEEKQKNKNMKTKNNAIDKPKLLTPSKSQAILRRNPHSPKKDKNAKDEKEKKPISNKKNLALSSKKNNKQNEKKKNIENESTNKVINNDKENINNNKEEKFPFYLFDSCCIKHDQIYSNYCYDCLRNICSVCAEKDHKNHNLENLNDIMIDEEKLREIKTSLEKNINDLKNINRYFNELIEKIKNQYSYFYSLKQKEIEIKQKIIKDFETIKYNYNSIQNINNLNYKYLNSNKNSIISNLEKMDNNTDLLIKLKMIFYYLDDLSQTKNGLNYYKKNYKNLFSNESREISNIIKLNNNDIGISFFDGCFGIYDVINFNQKLFFKIFENNKGIYNMTQLTNGDIAFCGYEKLKIFNVNLDNKSYYIKKEISCENGAFNLVNELGNNYLISYDTNKILKIFYNYKTIYEYKDINIDNILKIKFNLFITSSNKEKKINLYNIDINKNYYTEIKCDSLDNISVIKEKNSMIKLNNNYIVAIVSYDEKKHQNDSEEKFEESKNSEETSFNSNGICLIEISSKCKFNVIQNIKNKIEEGIYINICKYINNSSFLALNDLGFIELWNLDKINKKLEILNKFKAIDDIYSKLIRNIIFFEDKEKIILQSYKNIICLSNE